MPAINADTVSGWRQIAADVSRQRPYAGRLAIVFRGRKLRGETVTVVRHQRSKFGNAFRYGGEANLHLREMMGRSGFTCLVRSEGGVEGWVSAENLACIDAGYTCWSAALSDAVGLEPGLVDREPRAAARKP